MSAAVLTHLPPPRMAAVAQLTRDASVHVLTLVPSTDPGRVWIAYWRSEVDGRGFVDGSDTPVAPSELAAAVDALTGGLDWSEARWRIDPHPEIETNVWVQEMAHAAATLRTP